MAVDFMGDRYTWGRGEIKERLDWALINAQARFTFDLSKVQHLMNFGSDHRPIFLRLDNSTQMPRPNIGFKCEAAWVLEHSFPDLVKESWNGKSWLEGVKCFADSATEWSRKTIGNISYKKRKLRLAGIDKEPM